MMRTVSLVTVVAAALLFLSIIENDLPQVNAATQNLLNHDNCLYAYMSDAGKYEAVVVDAADRLTGQLQKFNYDPKCACTSEANNKTTPGSLIINFEINDTNFVSMKLDMQINSRPKEYYWEISKATLTVQPINGQMFPITEFDLKSSSGDIYASQQQSYSCSSLVLVNRSPTGNLFRITLRRFQVQPFRELNSTIFASSHDCSNWLTLPQIMGFLLMLFILFTVLIGVYLLLELGGHSSDLRFSKQGGMLMNQAQLDATKAD